MLAALPCSKLRHPVSLLQLPGLVLLFNSFWEVRLGSEASGLLKVAMDRQVGALPSIQEHLLTGFPPGKTKLTAFLKSTTTTCCSFILPSHKEMSPRGQKSLFSPQFIQLNQATSSRAKLCRAAETTIWRERACTSHHHRGRRN